LTELTDKTVQEIQKLNPTQRANITKHSETKLPWFTAGLIIQRSRSHIGRCSTNQH